MTTSPLIKICGLTRAGDVDVCAAAGVDAVGLNFYPSSPRYLDVSRAEELRGRLPSSIRAVGVFVRPDPEELIRTVTRLRIDVVQLHGADEAYLSSLSPLPVPLWLALGVRRPRSPGSPR
jgi:phosphoribosylanthranilate isomerase